MKTRRPADTGDRRAAPIPPRRTAAARLRTAGAIRPYTASRNGRITRGTKASPEPLVASSLSENSGVETTGGTS